MRFCRAVVPESVIYCDGPSKNWPPAKKRGKNTKKYGIDADFQGEFESVKIKKIHRAVVP
jgi:hypothetical protein